MDFPTIETVIGYSSALLVSLLNLPQAVKIYRQRSADGISMATIALHLGNSLLWLLYGSLLGQLPIILANCSYLLTNVAMLALKLRFQVGGSNLRSKTA